MDHEILLDKLSKILNSYWILYHEKKQKIFCRYLTRKWSKKLLFYLNPVKKWVIFWIGHYGTNISQELPTLSMLADDHKTSVSKFLIQNEEDITKKWIHFLIETCIDIAGKTFFKYPNFSLKKLEKSYFHKNTNFS